MCIQGSESPWAPLVASLPLGRVDTPVLWSEGERSQALMGSPCLAEAQARSQALDQEWESVAAVLSGSEAAFPPGKPLLLHPVSGSQGQL